MKNAESVKVIVRCRPMSKREIQDNRQIAATVDGKRGEITVVNPQKESEQPKTFTFDKAFQPDCLQSSVYDEAAYPIVESVLKGYNGTIFAYGQTGTGKTHTMEGNINVPDQRGIIPRTFEHIFKTINGTPGVQFMVRASMFELYNEEIRDLLNKGQKKLEIREKQGGVYIKDLSTFMIQNTEELMDKLNFGKENRQVGATQMNQDSSRSHSVFSITVETCIEQNGDQRITQGKLNLVDLAGSERQQKTQATGDRLKEAISINQSLTTLGNVISALVDGKSQHIPYRDSKLTRILQDSLGGNTKTVMVANIGPADYNYDETVTTLRYAWRAKSIKNKPKINEDPKDAMIRQFQDEITKLKEQLAGAAEGSVVGADGEVQYVEKIVKVHDEKKIEETEKKMAEEKERVRKEFEEQRKKIANQKNIEEAEKRKLLQKLKEKEDEQKAQREQQERLLKKIKKMEEKVILGQNEYQEALEKERQLKLHQEENEQKQREKQKYEQEIKEKELLTQSLTQKYHSQKEEAEDKTRRIQELHKRFQEIDMENRELEEFLQGEINDLQDRRRDLQKELQLKNLILEYFVPERELERLQMRAVFNEDIDDWMYPNLHLAGNILRMERGGKDENPMEQEIEEIHNLNLNGHPNVFFAYTDEGPIREEELNPQEKEKIQNQRKKKMAEKKRSKQKKQQQ